MIRLKMLGIEVPFHRMTAAPSTACMIEPLIRCAMSTARSAAHSATAQPPNPAPVSRAPYAPAATRRVDEGVELGSRDAEVVAQ